MFAELDKMIDDGATVDAIRHRIMRIRVEAENLEDKYAKLWEAHDKLKTEHVKRQAFLRHQVTEMSKFVAQSKKKDDKLHAMEPPKNT